MFEVNAQTMKYQLGSFTFNEGNCISVDFAGNSFITGNFQDTAKFGNIQFTGGGAFVAKYDTNGNCIWAKQAFSCAGKGISVDGNGNSYVTGGFWGTAIFDTFQISEDNGLNLNTFIAKYNTDGNCLWVRIGGGREISVDANGNCYVIGSFGETATFGKFTLTSKGYTDIFIAKYDSNGNCLWASQAGGEDVDIGFGISVDGKGNSYITGMRDSPYTDQDNENSDSDIFIAKYDANGNCLWEKKAEETDKACGYDISVDSDGNSYITGSFRVQCKFGLSQIYSDGRDDILIAKFDSSGKCLWIKNAGGTEANDFGYGISIDKSGDSYITGICWGSTKFGTIQVKKGGGFIAKYNPKGKCLWAKNTWNGYFNNNALDDKGNSYVIGDYRQNARFGNIKLTSYGVTDIFIAKYDPKGNCLWVKKAGRGE